MLHRLALITLLTLVVAFGVAGTASPASHATLAQAQAAGWDCSPNFTIVGYFHCAPPGKPSLLNLITGAATPPSLHLNVYYGPTFGGRTGLLAGTEQLIRADLFGGQPCPQEGGSWAFLNFAAPAADYYACHHFAA